MQANSRRVQVGWGTSGCERSDWSLAKLSIEISLTRKRVKGGQKRDILRSESILVELTGAPIEKRMLRPVLLLRYKPMIVLSWTTVTIQSCEQLLPYKSVLLFFSWTNPWCSCYCGVCCDAPVPNLAPLRQDLPILMLCNKQFQMFEMVWCEPYFAQCIS